MEQRGIRHPNNEVGRRWLAHGERRFTASGSSADYPRVKASDDDRGVEPQVRSQGRPEPRRAQTLFLIVDDDPDDFALLERALKKVDELAPISWAQDGTEVIDALARFRDQFDQICLIVDIHLPDMDGFELFDTLRERDLCHGIQIVFMTGNTNPALQVRARACGAHAFFLKPVRPSQFVEIARQLTELSRHGSNQAFAVAPFPT